MKSLLLGPQKSIFSFDSLYYSVTLESHSRWQEVDINFYVFGGLSEDIVTYICVFIYIMYVEAIVMYGLLCMVFAELTSLSWLLGYEQTNCVTVSVRGQSYYFLVRYCIFNKWISFSWGRNPIHRSMKWTQDIYFLHCSDCFSNYKRILLLFNHFFINRYFWQNWHGNFTFVL